MHDAKALLGHPDSAVSALARRGSSIDLQGLSQLVERRGSLITARDASRTQSKQIAARTRGAKDLTERQALQKAGRDAKRATEGHEAALAEVEAELEALLLAVPNLPLPDVPDGDSEAFAVPIKYWGEIPTFAFEPLDHATLGTALGVLDLAAGVDLAGPRFAVLRGAGARLERGLANFFLDLHTGTHGYLEHSVPAMVTRQTMQGTGQLPKFENDLFKIASEDRDAFLIPTGEVPLTNLVANKVLDPADLPLAFVAHTPCFRSEAGSYGRDTRGLIRMHQFSKVELVRIVEPDEALANLDAMVAHAERCLQELELPYRVVELPAGDLGFAAEKTFDLEVWLPGQGKYREISSVSSCGQFQGRRANIRIKRPNGKPVHAATLNGSGLPIGRTIAAILENNQDSNGRVRVPRALVPYVGCDIIE